jgi:hypothetical protein
MNSFSDTIRALVQTMKLAVAPMALDPNDDPAELYKQVRPLLVKMGLSNLTDKGKLQLVEGMTQGLNSQYQVCLRRGAVIDKDIITRIKRNESYFEKIVWDSRAIQVFVWYPYKPPEAAKTPAAPGIPPAVAPMAPK